MDRKRPHWILNRHLEVIGGPDGLVAVGVGSPTQVRDLEREMRWYPHTSFIPVPVPDFDQEEANTESVKHALKEITTSIHLQHPHANKVLILLCDKALQHQAFLHPLKATAYPVVYANTQHHSFFGQIVHQWFESFIPHILCGAQQGDVLEFGSYMGSSMTSLYYAFASYCPWMRFFAFDAFGGLHGLSPQESGQLHFIYEGGYFANRSTFLHYMRFAGIPSDDVTAVECDFLTDFDEPETLRAQLNLKTCLLAHIDCDVYAPALAALEFIEPLTVQGTILVFDDYFLFNGSEKSGEKRALKEWLERHPDIHVEPLYMHAVAKSFLVNREH